MNSVAEALTGWRQAAALGQDVRMVVGDLTDQFGQPVENPICLALQERTTETMLFRRVLLLQRDHEVVAIDHTVSLLADASGRVTGAALVFRDISHLIEGDKEWVKGAFHTLRTPLTMVLGYAEFLESYGLDEMPQAVSNPVRHIAGHARAMSTIVNDMMLAIETRAGQRVRTMVQVDTLVSSALEEFAPIAAERGLELKGQIEDRVPAVFGDGSGLEWVIDQLLDNAVMRTPTGGCVAVSLKREANGLHLAVRGTGVRTPEMHTRCECDRPSSADDSAQRWTNVPRIGLSLVRSIVSDSSGRVDFNGMSGGGSEFHVYLPVT